MQSIGPNIERIDIGIKILNISIKNICTQDKVTPKIVIDILHWTGGPPWALTHGFPFGFGAGSAKVC